MRARAARRSARFPWSYRGSNRCLTRTTGSLTPPQGWPATSSTAPSQAPAGSLQGPPRPPETPSGRRSATTRTSTPASPLRALSGAWRKTPTGHGELRDVECLAKLKASKMTAGSQRPLRASYKPERAVPSLRLSLARAVATGKTKQPEVDAHVASVLSEPNVGALRAAMREVGREKARGALVGQIQTHVPQIDAMRSEADGSGRKAPPRCAARIAVASGNDLLLAQRMTLSGPASC